MAEWKTFQTTEDNLELELNRLEELEWFKKEEWFVFQIVPSILFGGKAMGVKLPSAVVINIICERGPCRR